MRNSLRGLALVAGLAAMTAGRADAQFVWSGCGGNNFNTCASVNITFSSGLLTMTVQNWGNYNPATNSFASLSGSSIFTAVGIANFGTGSLTSLNGSATCTNDTGGCAWVIGVPPNGLPEVQAGANATPPPTSNGLNPPASPGAGQYSQVVLVFNTSGVIDLSGATFGLHGQSGPPKVGGGTCSTKLLVTLSNGTYTPNVVTPANDPGTCQSFNPPTETPVPEPASMVLLATGLVAMSGAGIIRRRRNRKV